MLYPNAHVVALEPDPSAFSYLTSNVATFQLTDVTLHNAAVWTKTTDLPFHADGADGGRVVTAGSSLRVRAIDIAELLKNQRIDFLKMDIEGAEEEVLPACSDFLPDVSNVFVEYHSNSQRPQRLDQIITLLSAAGFRLSLTTIKSKQSAFVPDRLDSNEFDLQINISGFRQ